MNAFIKTLTEEQKSLYRLMNIVSHFKFMNLMPTHDESLNIIDNNVRTMQMAYNKYARKSNRITIKWWPHRLRKRKLLNVYLTRIEELSILIDKDIKLGMSIRNNKGI